MSPERIKRGHWASLGEAGSYLGLQFFFWTHRLFGRFLFRVFLVPVMGYFFLRRGSARRASRVYLETLWRDSPAVLGSRPGAWTVYRHFLSFGESLLDKVIAWSGDLPEDALEVVDRVAYDRVKASSRGRLLISSHFGNPEFCRGFAGQHRDLVINVLMHDRHAVNFSRLMSRVNPSSRLSVYQVSDLDIPTMLRLKDKIAAGEWLVIAGDRVPVGEAGRTVEADFLGRRAPFPVGPFVLAATLECPVTLLFAYRRGSRVAMAFEEFAERLELPRRDREERLRDWAQRYADRLAHHCRAAPLQWFNFYPFWTPQESSHG